MQRIKETLTHWLQSGQVDRVLGWKEGDMTGLREPAFFENAEELKSLCYDAFCGPNLSKFLIAAGEKDGVTAVLLKPCDSYSLNELIRENRVQRDRVKILAVPCEGNIDPRVFENRGVLSVHIEGDQLHLTTCLLYTSGTSAGGTIVLVSAVLFFLSWLWGRCRRGVR